MYRAYGAISLLVITTTTAAQQNALTEETAIRLGLSRDPVQLRTVGNITQAQSDVIAAGKRPNPEISYERETLDNDEDHVEQKLLVSQQFDFSGRRALHMQAADRHLDAAQYQSDAWRADLMKDIRARYYSTLLQQQRRQSFATTQKRIGLLSRALEKRRREGDVSIYDYQRVSTERAAIEAEVSNAEVDFHTAWQTLWALLGTDSQDFQSLEGELLPGRAAPLEQLTASLENLPSLRHLKEQSEAFTLQQRAESRSFPDVTLGLGLKREENNDQSDNGLVLNASIPIPVFDKRKDKQTRYQAQAMIARSKYQLAHDTARAELRGLWQQGIQYQRTAAKFRQDAVHSADELINIAEAYYRAGEVGILELLDAYRSALNAELTALNLEFKARSAHIKLDHLSGGPVQ
jgi:cobalt-zinc-cadmium efflux system outer membrane protein